MGVFSRTGRKGLRHDYAALGKPHRDPSLAAAALRVVHGDVGSSVFLLVAQLMLAPPAHSRRPRPPRRLACNGELLHPCGGRRGELFPVGLDGLISFPLAGDVRAAGRTLNDVRSADALTRQPFRRQASDTGASTGASTYSIMANEISLQIVEFRPVYVNGDVLHPGQVKYRPGLTVRQAVAVAGGCGRVQPIGGPQLRRIPLQRRRLRPEELLLPREIARRAIPVPRGSSADG